MPGLRADTGLVECSFGFVGESELFGPSGKAVVLVFSRGSPPAVALRVSRGDLLG